MTFILKTVAPLVVACGFVASAAGQPTVLPNGQATINLSRGTGFVGTNTMALTHHPGFNQYYGGNGGSGTFSGFVWDASGTLIQTLTPINVDIRGVNYNANTNTIQVVTFNAIAGGAPSALMDMGLTGAGLYTGSNTSVLATMPGLSSNQTMPAYDSDTNRFFSRSTGTTVNIVSGVDGTLVSSVNLDLAPVGNPTLKGNFLGYDSFFDVFVTLENTADPRAFVHNLDGSFIGASQLSGVVSPPANFNSGYTNGQVFVFDSSINSYRGFVIFAPIPEPGSLLLGGLALATGAGAVWRRRLRRSRTNATAGHHS